MQFCSDCGKGYPDDWYHACRQFEVTGIDYDSFSKNPLRRLKSKIVRFFE